MPDSRVPRDADPTPEETPAGAETPGTEASGPEASAADEPAGFENRAARRAKGKDPAQQQQSHGKTKSFGARGSVQGPRQWGNRRSG
jgi:hypothetical protein